MKNEAAYLPSENVWTDPKTKREWLVRLLWDRIDGRVACVGVEVRSVRLPRDKHSTVLNQPQYEDVPGTALDATDRNRRVPVGSANELVPAEATADLLRRLNLGRVIRRTLEQQAHFHKWWSQQETGERREELDLAASERAEAGDLDGVKVAVRVRRRGRPGRPPVSDEVLDRVADIYKRNPAAPQRAVAQQMGWSPTWAARRIHEARERGNLKIPSKRRSKE